MEFFKTLLGGAGGGGASSPASSGGGKEFGRSSAQTVLFGRDTSVNDARAAGELPDWLIPAAALGLFALLGFTIIIAVIKKL